MKKKLFLAITAIALVTALAVGGTLMLFSAQTEKATNVVTMGNASIRLEEKGGDVYRNGTAVAKIITTGGTYKTVDKNFTGLDWGINKGFKAIPGDKMAKAPRVFNDGSIPVYVKMQADLLISANNNDTIISDQLVNEIHAILADPSQPFFNEMFIGLSNNWKIDIDNISCDKVGPGAIQVKYDIYYTVTKSGITTLASVAPKDATADLFTHIGIPFAMPNFFEDFTFVLDLTAFAVQSDNHDSGTTLVDWAKVFPPVGDYNSDWNISDVDNFSYNNNK